jgi:hypothetical protein
VLRAKATNLDFTVYGSFQIPTFTSSDPYWYSLPTPATPTVTTLALLNTGFVPGDNFPLLPDINFLQLFSYSYSTTQTDRQMTGNTYYPSKYKPYPFQNYQHVHIGLIPNFTGPADFEFK